jgi:hypothetical protein
VGAAGSGGWRRASSLAARSQRDRHRRGNPPVPADLPTDDELSATDDPAVALLRLWRNRGRRERRETVAAHILASRYTTEEVAWQLPVVDLERHPLWGDRLADRIVATCGDSPARWQELTRSWGHPTQLLTATLLKRLEGIDT